MIVIRWYGAFKIEDGKVVDEYIFPPERRAEILKNVRMGDFSMLREFIGDDTAIIEGEIKDKKELISTAIEMARIEMREKLGEDYKLIESLNTYDDIVSTLNLMNERILEWRKIEEIKGEKDSIHILLEDELKSLEKMRDEITKDIERRAKKICPNLSELVGPVIAARLIASAGSLKRLAKLPASTIQVLGAEESFFRHLKSGAKCPKHGIIFRVPMVRNAPKNLRGKIARSLAAKIAIAARVDYYGGKFIGEELKEEMEKRVEEIKNDSNRKGK